MTPVYYSILEQLVLAGFYYSLEREAVHCLDCYFLFKVGVVVVVVAGWKTGCWSQFAMLIRTSKGECKVPSPAAVTTLTGGVVTRPMSSLCKQIGVAQRRCFIISSSELYFEHLIFYEFSSIYYQRLFTSVHVLNSFQSHRKCCVKTKTYPSGHKWNLRK